MTTSLRSRLRSVGYRTFYRLPPWLRRRLVRLGSPTYTVGALNLVQDGDKLLLLRQPPGFGWGLPGGLINRRERPADGAARELFEETGIRLDPSELTPAVPNAIVHTAGTWIDVVFRAEVSAAEHDLVIDGAEVLEAGWFPLDSLPPLTVPTSRLLANYGIGPYVDYPEAQQ